MQTYYIYTEHDSHHDNVALHANGVHAIAMHDTDFKNWLSQHEYTFVNFYAPWCIWCQRFEPVWEAFAEELDQHPMSKDVSIVKVDCVANKNLCMEQRIQAFPTVRLFKGLTPETPDYRDVYPTTLHFLFLSFPFFSFPPSYF